MSTVSRRCCPMLLLLRILLQVLYSSASGIATYKITPPTVPLNLTESNNKTIAVSVQIPESEWASFKNEQYALRMSSYHPDVASVNGEEHLRKEDFTHDVGSNQYSYNTTFTVYGHSLGRTGLRVRLVSAESWNETDDWWKPSTDSSPPKSSDVLDVAVLRSESAEKLTTYFVISVVLLVILGNVVMGCEIDVDVVLKTIKKPVAPAIGLFAQFLIMPLLAYAIAKSIFVPRGLYSMALGLFITGCSPGGGASNFWTLLLDGNVNLSVTMTFLSTLASLGLMPFWIKMLGAEFLQGFSTKTHINVPTMNIIRGLCSLIIPILVGVAIQKWKPTWAAKLRKCVRPFIIFVLIFVVVFGTLSNLYMFKMMTWPALLGGLLLPWCGFMFGCFTSIVMGRSPADVTAIAIETGIQNTGIAIIMLKAAFTQPDADIGAVLPVIVACFTPAPLLLGAAIHMAVKRLKRRKTTSNDVKAASTTVTLELPECDSKLLVDPSKLESQNVSQ